MSKQEEVAAMHQQMRAEYGQIVQKIAELEQEKNEHQLVLDAINPLDSNRKCFRLVGGVLVERTVGEVIPAVKRNADGLNDLVKQLQETLKKKEADLHAFQQKHNIQMGKDQGQSQASSQGSQQSSGVLV